VWEAYRRRGITREPETHGRPPPVLGDLQEALQERGALGGLPLRLARYTGGALARFFAGETTVDLRRPLVAFDVRDVEREARPVVFYLVTDHIWREVRRRPRPRLVVIDEAWTLLQHDSGAAFVETLARRARKYYLGLTVISQDVEDVLTSRQGRVVLRNSAVHVLLRQDPSAREVVREAFRLSEREWAFLVSCRPGMGIMLLGRERVPLQVVASPAEHQLCTTDPREVFAST
jgi:conjugal transfer ATP-binding protein TraC